MASIKIPVHAVSGWTSPLILNLALDGGKRAGWNFCRFTRGASVPVTHCRGKSPNMGRCIVSYQEVLHTLLKNENNQAHEAVCCNRSINGPLLRTSVLTGRLCFGALWRFCLSLNCDSWAVKGKLFFWITLVLSSLFSAILNSSFVS